MAKHRASRRRTIRQRDLKCLDARVRDVAANASEAFAYANALQSHLDNLAQSVLATASLLERLKRQADGE